MGSLGVVVDRCVSKLDFLAEAVLGTLPRITRQKYEQLMTELIHERDVTRKLMETKVTDEHLRDPFFRSLQTVFKSLPNNKLFSVVCVALYIPSGSSLRDHTRNTVKA